MAAVAAGVAATAMAVAAPAHAAPKVRFRIPPKVYSEALIDLALQSDVSLLGAAFCTGVGPALNGAYTVDGALRRLLADADCTWRIPAAGVVQISPLTQRAPQAVRAPTEVSEILITATKRVQSTSRLAASVSALTRRQLATSGANDPGDTSGQLSGVLTTDLGPARDKLLLRGLSDGAFTGRSRSTVGTYLDDAPLNYNAPDPDLRLVDVERVEVIRGPQGALYGGGSLSGLYRIVSRKPDLYNSGAELRLTGALTYSGDPSHATEGWANIPIAKGVAAVRVSAYHETQGGYLDDFGPVNANNVDRTRRYGGRVILSFRPNDTWSLDLTAAGQHLTSDDTHYTQRGLKLERFHRIAEPHENDFGLASATVRGSFDWGDVVSSTAYVQHLYSSVYDASRVITLFSELDRTGLGVYVESTRTRMAVQDIVLTSRGSGPIGWLAGAYASSTVEKAPGRILAGGAAPYLEAYSDDRRDRIQELAVYGEVSYQFAPGWTAAAGARLFQTRVRTRSSVTSELDLPRTLNATITASGISPKITLQRDFGSGGLVYAVISEGHRAGGINTSGAKPLLAEEEIFRPDQLINFELGGKAWLLNRQLAVNAALFYDIWKNIQTDQFRPSGIPYTANVGDAGILGFEAEATYAAPFGLSVQANVLLSRTNIRRVSPTSAPQAAKGLPNAPDVSFGLTAAYERRLTQRLSWRLTGAANYVGASRVTFDPTLSAKMGDYARMKFATGLAGRGWDAELFITNPLNQLSNTFAFGNPFTFVQAQQTTPQRPRTIGLTLTASR